MEKAIQKKPYVMLIIVKVISCFAKLILISYFIQYYSSIAPQKTPSIMGQVLLSSLPYSWVILKVKIKIRLCRKLWVFFKEFIYIFEREREELLSIEPGGEG